MFSSGKKIFKFIRCTIDIVNVILGIGVVALAVMTFLNTASNLWLFPVIFLMGATMNLLTGIKHLLTEKRGSGIAMLVIAAVIYVIAFVSYGAIGG